MILVALDCTRTAMPLSRAPVSVIIPRKPPRIITKRADGQRRQRSPESGQCRNRSGGLQ